MNRIREYNDLYQVLVTPVHRFDNSFELMLGNWNDENLKNFKVVEFSNYNDAMGLAFKYPDISWEKLNIFHIDSHTNLSNIIKKHLDRNKFMCEFHNNLMKPDEIKNIMFDRVIQNGDRFRLKYNSNDIISFNIVNPWSVNLKEISNVLKIDKTLNIKRLVSEHNIIRLIGLTDLGTSYEIVLWPSLLYQWAKWKYLNPQLSNENIYNRLKEILQAQKYIDSTSGLR